MIAHVLSRRQPLLRFFASRPVKTGRDRIALLTCRYHGLDFLLTDNCDQIVSGIMARYRPPSRPRLHSTPISPCISRQCPGNVHK
jgi:hypothetical protein